MNDKQPNKTEEKNGAPAPTPTTDWVPKLTEELETFRAQQGEIMKAQEVALAAKDQEKYVELYLQFNEVTREINNRQMIIELFSGDEDKLASEYYKADFWNYLVAAETISLELVNELTNRMYEAAKKGFKDYESYEQFQSPYKNIVLPGKIIAGRYDELDPLIDEMTHYIQQVIPAYDRSKSLDVLPVAFGMAIDSDTANTPIKAALEKRDFQWLMPEEKERLLAEVVEQEAFVTDAREQDKLVAQARYRQNLEEAAK